MPVSLAAPQQSIAQTLSLGYDAAKKEVEDRMRQIGQQRASNFALPGPAGAPRGGGGDRDDIHVRKLQAEADKDLNRAANDLLLLDVIAGATFERRREAAPPAAQEGLSVTYTIPARTTLPSRSDRQLIQIASIPMKAQFVKVASPVLTEYVYDEAWAVNTSPTVLLPGPITAYADGAFVGTGELPLTSAGQRFSAGFGIDSTLRTSRELIERSESTQGGNRVVDLTYRLTVQNFADAPAPIRLMDRLPRVSDQAADIRLTLLSPGADLSSDAEYLAGPRKQGILRWDLTVPPQSHGSSAFVIEYKFRLEFDKQMSLVGMGG
jgi:uncharacterized protein (TIGR02231 family)